MEVKDYINIKKKTNFLQKNKYKIIIIKMYHNYSFSLIFHSFYTHFLFNATNTWYRTF